MKVTRMNSDAVNAIYSVEDMTEEEQALSADAISDLIRYNYGAYWLRKEGKDGIIKVFID